MTRLLHKDRRDGMRTALVLIAFCALGTSRLINDAVAGQARIKDIALIKGVRGNPVLGYGLVVGLNGTGDNRQTLFTTQSLANLLERQGITVPASAIKVENVAAVMVTASLPPFARSGSRLDVTVSSVGDAESLQGGILLMTALRAGDNRVYAVAQGPITLGGFSAGGNSRVQSNHPTVGRIAYGAVVEREPPGSFAGQATLTYLLRQEDFTTARHMKDVINKWFGGDVAQALDSRTVQIAIPEQRRSNLVEFIADVENLKLEIGTRAKVVLNERTGTVVLGGDVKLSAVAVIHGNLTVQIQTDLEVSQPYGFSQGTTQVVPQETTKVEEAEGQQILLKEGASVKEVVQALNMIGATPRDVIAIFEAIKAAGALSAELEII